MAAVDSISVFLRGLQQTRLLESGQADHVKEQLTQGVSPVSIGKELVGRGLATPYQIDRLLGGRADALVVGNYLILDKLGEGGAGEVFKARHRAMNRLAAVKIIREALLSQSLAVQRFYREIEATARLHHPHIITAYDAGPVGATHFFAMEYVEGPNLSKLISTGGPLPTATACAYVRQAALALEYAHGQGMVHRDIKPSNLILTGRDGGIKMLDMGLVRFDRPNSGDEPATLTEQGEFLGTPDFMAPEQGEDTRSVDHRADLYSLGATLYFLLSGKFLFPDCTLFQKVVRLQTAEPTPLEQLCPNLPPALPILVRKLLAKKPDDRLQSAGEVVRALDAVAKGGSRPALPRPKVNQNTPTSVRTQVPARANPPAKPKTQEPAPAAQLEKQPTPAAAKEAAAKEPAAVPELWQQLQEEEPPRRKGSDKKARPTEDKPVRRKAERSGKVPPGRALPGNRRRPLEIPSWVFPVLGTLLVILLFGVGGGYGFYYLYAKYGVGEGGVRGQGSGVSTPKK